MSLYNSDLGEKKVKEILNKKDLHLHFLGIAGAGMSPLAELLLHRGITVSGTDGGGSEALIRLAEQGAIIGKPLSNVFLPDAVVYTLAIPESCPELIAARELGIPVLSRAELLGGVMLSYNNRIGVAGTHGKSTTTAMLHRIFTSNEKAPTVISGASLTTGSALSIGEADTFIFEACEYKDSFLLMRPTVSLITNIELDHTDYFHSEEQISLSFLKFAQLGRCALINYSDRLSRKLLSKLGCKYLTYGSENECDFSYTDVEFSDTGTAFSLLYRQERVNKVKMPILGIHNVSNALAAIAAATSCGIDVSDAARSLEGFSGIERRLELLGYIGERAVYYDYAHHPTEIRSTLSALKSRFGKVVCIFRPHTYSRTAGLFDDFIDALSLADCSILLDIYPAREEAIDGITSEYLAHSIGERSIYLSFSDAVPYCLDRTDGTIVLMGAGEVDQVKKELISYINEE